MKPITERQMQVIKDLAKATKANVDNVHELTCAEASELIGSLINRNRAKNANKGKDAGRADRSTDALAGLAVKILAQKSEVGHIEKNEEEFKQGVVRLYRIFFEARQACLA